MHLHLHNAEVGIDALESAPLKPNKRYGNSLGYFFYRWNQGCDEKIIIGSSNKNGGGLAAIAARGTNIAWW